MSTPIQNYTPLSSETRERRTRLLLSKQQLEAVLCKWALDAEGLKPGGGVNVEIRIEDNTEGSPSYRSGHKATIIIDRLGACRGEPS